MATGIILPVPKALYLCEGYISYPAARLTDLMNIFNFLQPPNYPYFHQDFVVYARLSGGLGQIPFFIEIHDAATQQLVHVSSTFTLSFPDRDRTVELAVTMPRIPFPQPGVYTVELWLNNQWLCDCTLELL